MKIFWQHCSHHLLCWVTVCCIAGATTARMAGEAFPHQYVLPVVVPLLLLLAIAGYRLPRLVRPAVTLPFFFLVGAVHTHCALHPPDDPTHLCAHIIDKTKATVVGTILTMPEYNGKATRLLVDCEALLKDDPDQPASFQPVRGKLLLSVQDRLPPAMQAGTSIMAIAVLDRIHRYQTPGAFDFRLQQMATGNVRCSGWVESSGAIETVKDASSARPFFSRLQRLRFFPEQMRTHMALFLERILDREVAGLFQALLIGSLVNISPETLDAFKVSGCFHILSISGLHFSLLGLFVLTVFVFLLKQSRWLLLHTHVPTLGLLLTAPVLLLYAFVAGMSLPTLRSLITALLVLVAVLLRRQRSLLPLIAAAALVILALNPLALFTASFQLSFAAVLAINCIYPGLPVFTAEIKGDRFWQRALEWGWRTGQSMLLVSLAATLGTLPIMLMHFNQVSLVGPVMNLVIEPLLCLWPLPAGLVAFPLLWVAPDLAALVLKIGALGIRGALWLVKPLPHLPGAALWTITPSSVEMSGYFLLIWLLIKRPPIPWRLPIAAMLALGLAGSFTFSWWTPWKRRELSVHFLDVGQGSSTLLQLPNGANILLDGGGDQSDRFDPGQNLLAPFLWQLRIWRLDEVIVTHPHGDHYNGVPFVMEHFHPKRLLINDDEGTEPAYHRMLAAVRKAGVPVQTLIAGTMLHQDDRFQMQCLGMPGLIGPSGWTTNDRSLVFSVRYGNHGFVFPADIEAAGERVLLASGAALKADVLLAPHHGSRSSSTPEFIAAVDPSLIIASAGRSRRGLFPAPEHLRRWAEQKMLPLTTAQDGTITCLSNGNRLRVQTFAGQRFVVDRNTSALQGQ